MMRKELIVIFSVILVSCLIYPVVYGEKSEQNSTVFYRTSSNSDSIEDYAIHPTIKRNYTYIWEDSYNGEYNYSVVTAKLLDLNETYSDILDVFSLHETSDNNSIWCVRLTDKTITTTKTQFYIVAANEPGEDLTITNALYFIDKIIYDFENVNDYDNILANSEIYIIPMLYPNNDNVTNFPLETIYDFMNQHNFNRAISLTTGNNSIVSLSDLNYSLPEFDENEILAVRQELQNISSYSFWEDLGLNTPSFSHWLEYIYEYHGVLGFSFQLETNTSLFPYLNYSELLFSDFLYSYDLIFDSLLFLASEPRLTYTNSFPELSVKNPPIRNQVFTNYTVEWQCIDADDDPLNFSIYISLDGLKWEVVATNLLNVSYYIWDVSSTLPGSYYIKVAAHDGKDWVHNSTTVKLNVKKEMERSNTVFWLISGIFLFLAMLYYYRNAKKTRDIQDDWMPKPQFDE